ncbi:MAG TPA: hypothetical protein ENI33_00805 [Thermoplasmatales archaeon]|nr:hypothetical protein [Thermoplasmatales archaeon]
MKQKNLLRIIVIISIIYFIWLFIDALNEVMNGTKLLLSLKTWSIIGVVIYIVFLVVEIILYFATPQEKIKEIKLVSPALKKIVCSNCKTTFTISDDGIRPVYYACPNCGKEGVIKGKKIEGISKLITCSNCDKIFEIIDTGDRPLTYECPSCHFRGDVS